MFQVTPREINTHGDFKANDSLKQYMPKQREQDFISFW